MHTHMYDRLQLINRHNSGVKFVIAINAISGVHNYNRVDLQVLRLVHDNDIWVCRRNIELVGQDT